MLELCISLPQDLLGSGKNLSRLGSGTVVSPESRICYEQNVLGIFGSVCFSPTAGRIRGFFSNCSENLIGLHVIKLIKVWVSPARLGPLRIFNSETCPH